ncbi:MAG TPA: hypothetical protein VFS22_05530, partial [Flavisolibacter sp.]|nr:hypothetical protein [Flavisolibacter sp.]
MNTNLFFLSASLVMVASTATAQQKPFTIEGTITGKTDGYIYLAYKGSAYDSSLINNGRFS